MVRNWRKPPKIAKPKYREGYRDLTLYAVNHGERIRVFPFDAEGALDPAVQDDVRQLFRDKETDAQKAIHPRIIKLLYKIADRFNARQVNIISGYREAPDSPRESNHKRGKAVDFMVPGTGLGAVARYARSLGHVGVGYYPSSGFIHLDVRDGPSYFWVDRSGPGLGPCVRPMMKKAARKMDRKWRPEKDEPEPERNKRGELKDSSREPARKKKAKKGKKRRSSKS
jgi:uncharacterized protein YcbK (DUF882 family)